MNMSSSESSRSCFCVGTGVIPLMRLWMKLFLLHELAMLPFDTWGLMHRLAFDFANRFNDGEFSY
jgi:hypothetical protein